MFASISSQAVKRLNLPTKSHAFLAGRLSCVGVTLNLNSFRRNGVTTFLWPGCFKSILAFVIQPQNAKNPSCVGARCAFSRTFYRSDDFISSTKRVTIGSYIM